jgi:hypothetical protein
LIYIAWWTGRGYYTLPILVASMVVFELARAALHLPDGLWVFGFALMGAAAANWVAGRKLNRESLKKVRTHRVRERLIYRARHKFMSVPMETFLIPMAVAGLAVLAVAAVLSFSPVVAQDTDASSVVPRAAPSRHLLASVRFPPLADISIDVNYTPERRQAGEA